MSIRLVLCSCVTFGQPWKVVSVVGWWDECYEIPETQLFESASSITAWWSRKILAWLIYCIEADDGILKMDCRSSALELTLRQRSRVWISMLLQSLRLVTMPPCISKT